MTERNTGKRLVAALGAAAVSVTAIVGAGSAAFAAPQDFGNIDTSREGSLTVHKYLHQVNPHDGDISQAPAEGDYTDPVEGVVFTAYPLLKSGTKIDLGVAAEWDQLADLKAGEKCSAPAGYSLGDEIVLPATDTKGVSSVKLPVGAYQVCETSSPDRIIDAASPFILTVPMPHESGWVYDVHAYPKNGEAVVEKTVEPLESNGLGSIARFPVTVAVPTTGDTWTGFAIRDTLDKRLEPVKAEDVKVTVDGAALDASFYAIDIAGQQVTVNFTAAGLAWLNEGPNAQAGKKIQAIFAGKVVEVGSGSITNEAELWVNNPDFDPSVQPPVPSNEVETNWGDLAVLKRAAGTEGDEGLLQGAVFEMYNAKDPYAADCANAEADGNAIAVNGETEFESSKDGVVTIAGLFVSDSVNPVVDAQQRCYVLKEVVAPTGYVLPAEPHTAVTVKIGSNTVKDNVEILNTQQDVPELPLTGAAGRVMLITAGAAALALALGLVLMNRRRQGVEA